MTDLARVRSLVHEIADWPEPGVLFRDLTPVIGDAEAFATVVDALATALPAERVDAVVGIEARGFIYGAALALRLGVGFVTMRKPGKLPGAVHSQAYQLEYGSTTLELHQHALGPRSSVVIVDDVLATGGTAAAAIDLVRRTGAQIACLAVVLELPSLGGRTLIEDRAVAVAALIDAEAPVD